MDFRLPLPARCRGRWKRKWELIRFGPPAGNGRRVLRRIKGWVLAMLASLRVAPVPLRAFEPVCGPRDPECRSAPTNGPFSLTNEWLDGHAHHSTCFESSIVLCAQNSVPSRASGPRCRPTSQNSAASLLTFRDGVGSDTSRTVINLTRVSHQLLWSGSNWHATA